MYGFFLSLPLILGIYYMTGSWTQKSYRCRCINWGLVRGLEFNQIIINNNKIKITIKFEFKNSFIFLFKILICYIAIVETTSLKFIAYNFSPLKFNLICWFYSLKGVKEYTFFYSHLKWIFEWFISTERT